VQTGGNRLLGFAQTSGGASTSVSYGYNANGDLTNDGLRTFTYDTEGRLSAVTTGASDESPTTRYAHNALGQRVFKTEPLYPPAEGDESDQGFMASLIAFFTSMWSPTVVPAENLGFAYAYDEDGTLLGEQGMGGANSSGQAFYLWMPTANGPIPVMMLTETARYAVHADHLNTPRQLTAWDGPLAWQWTYSAFGDAQPTVASRKFANVAPAPGDLEFNLRYPGQTADKESGLFYNYFRNYSSTTGRYTQSDPIGLDGGWNRFGYVSGNPLKYTDPYGLAEYLGLDGIVGHLEKLADAQGDDFWKAPWTGPERAMIARLRQGKDTPWDIGFYHHEKAEADMCRPYLNSPPEVYLRKQGEAHRQVEENQRNTQWDRYHPDVVRRFSDQFPTAPK
jgi:RHS repeat-associated protein